MKHNYVFIINYATQNSYCVIGKSTIETTQDNTL